MFHNFMYPNSAMLTLLLSSNLPQKKSPYNTFNYICISIMQSRKQDTNETQKDWDGDKW